MLQTSRIALLAAGLSSLIGACTADEPPKIALNAQRQQAEEPQPEERGIRIAAGGMMTPKEGMGYYLDLVRYVAKKAGGKAKYTDREGYAEINQMLKDGRLDAAFLCSGAYVAGHAQFGLELLAVPQCGGQTVHRSYIIVPKGSPARTFSDLRGKRFAFADPLSTTGTLVPTYLLARRKETPTSFFKQVVHTEAHDRSIMEVARQYVDGAAVDGWVWEYLNATNPEFTAQTRILEKSQPYALHPVVVPRNLAPELKERLRGAFLNAHADPEGRAILEKMRIDRFIAIDDGAYDPIREMQAWVDGRKRKESGLSHRL